MLPSVNIMWFRRDLRLTDNTALYHALTGNNPVLPVFIFDTNILTDLEDKADKRVSFIYQAIVRLQEALTIRGSSLEVHLGDPVEIFKLLTSRYQIEKVYANHDYEQYAIDRDARIEQLLAGSGIGFCTHKDQVIFEKLEICKEDGNPYTVFTPYSRKWKTILEAGQLNSYPSEKYLDHFYQHHGSPLPDLRQLGFLPATVHFPSGDPDPLILKNYQLTRNYPALQGTSRLGIHLRFGTVSIRKVAAIAAQYSEVFVNELIWRDFYQAILWNFPHVRKGESFKKEYDRIPWRNNKSEFESWCQGKTGYPIVDAGMRELNSTGFMHNRVRMIAASFLTKHLLVDWRWGEAYFAKKLLDFDYAANNGGWQWAAGSGCDAAPYFRIFNPALQEEKFDKDRRYIRTWIPELDSPNYPAPLVDHAASRKRALEIYGSILKG